jgi:hypothetical protein
MRRRLYVEDMKFPRSNNILFSVVVASAAFLTACGRYPAQLSSHRDIAFTSEGETHVNASQLNSEDFPALAKFTKLYEIDFDDNGGMDGKLEALAQIGFTNLAEVVITDCPLVTDKGLVFLSRIPSIKGLGLRGTSISDKSAEIMVAMPKLQVVNLANSTNITLAGLLSMERSDTMQELEFSCGNLTQDNLIEIISATRHLNRVTISEPPEGRIDAPTLRKAAEAKGIELYVVRNMSCSRL